MFQKNFKAGLISYEKIFVLSFYIGKQIEKKKTVFIPIDGNKAEIYANDVKSDHVEHNSNDGCMAV